MNPRNFRIAVVGAGAIGCYYGGKLARAGSDVHFLMRSDFAAVRRNGLTIRDLDATLRVAPVNCYDAAEKIGACDLVIIAVKTTANAALRELLPPLLHGQTMLLTLQNGLGNEEFLAREFGAARVLGGLCFVCLNRVAPGVIEHYDRGRLALGEFIGPPQARTAEVASHFLRAGIDCAVVQDLALERWRKLVWNVPFNGLAVTAGGKDTAAILADENLRRLTGELMGEVLATANACGTRLATSVADEQISRTKQLGPYKPSTLVDYEARRPLEIEAIWGEPLRRAQAAGVKTPRLRELYERLAELDTARREVTGT